MELIKQPKNSSKFIKEIIYCSNIISGMNSPNTIINHRLVASRNSTKNIFNNLSNYSKHANSRHFLMLLIDFILIKNSNYQPAATTKLKKNPSKIYLINKEFKIF